MQPPYSAAPLSDGLFDQMVALRRDLHAHPELAWCETRTTEVVGRELRRRGLSPSVLPMGAGLVCDVGGDDGPLVALRADLDALPMSDDSDASYRSLVTGVAHSCGHDAHTAIVVGAGAVLAKLASAGELPGRVRLLFQPAEEAIPGGALRLMEIGALDSVERVYALHCDPRLDAGVVGIREGPITAAADLLTVAVSGPGGHTARPHLSVDVVGALGDVATRAPLLLSRRADPRWGTSLVWGKIAAGSAPNIIPRSGELAGTVRSLTPAGWREAEQLVSGIVREVVVPYRAEVALDYLRGNPPAVNDGPATAEFADSARAVLGPGAVRAVDQSMGAEDFAWILERVPGVLARLGVRRPGATVAPDLHRGDFDIDERAIDCGMRVLVAGAVDSLRVLGSRTGR